MQICSNHAHYFLLVETTLSMKSSGTET